MGIVIKAEDISKHYHLGTLDGKQFYRDLIHGWRALANKKQSSKTEDLFIKKNEKWVLKNINFEVEQGEILGIIGKNGAGKSTLLKILSKITSPSTGNIYLKGRVSSLLEVGTGFHPDLTGMENIFLNGAILGMRKKEIQKKLDEIIAFSEVEEFIHTPVKRYSSGMYVRLAFAVAAHLESEILIVDEVLAVGDADFQKKCMGKMGEISKGHGRTILFVSHNLAAVRSLCTKGILLQSGEVKHHGDPLSALTTYQSLFSMKSCIDFRQSAENRPGNDLIQLIYFGVKPLSGQMIDISSGIEFEVIFINQVSDLSLDVTFELQTLDQTVVFHHGAIVSSDKSAQKGQYSVKGSLPGHFLNAGIYSFKIIFGKNQKDCLWVGNDLIQFEVLNESLGVNSNILPGVVRPNIQYAVAFQN